MELQKCARCKKRPAVVFITRLENGNTINEGLCLVCAKELNIKPIDDMLRKMGVNPEDLDSVAGEVEGIINAETSDENDDGGAPAMDFPKIFGNMGFPLGGMTMGNQKEDPNGKNRGEKKPDGRKFLRLYGTDLTAKAKEGKLDRMVGRERELDRVIQILCRRQKNNPCLIGEPGVGKTAIAEALAQRIVDGKVPERLRECEIWLLDLTSLVAGTQFRGQFEQRILGLIREVKSAGNVILMIDEIHNIVGAGDSEGSMSAANILKPALSRGEMQVIGATTLKEYRKYIEKDSALERRFQPITVNEPSIDDATDIIRGIKKYYEEFHGITIPDEIARFAVTMSERYITDRFLPDKAIDLIDEASSRKALTSPELNEYKKNEKALTALMKNREELENKTNAENEANYRALADLKVEQIRLEERQAELEGKIHSLNITVSDLASVIEIWTGIPATEIKEDELSELIGLEERISSHIIGQSEAVNAVARAVKRKRVGLSYRHNPVSMIFAGPTGVGKTELVKVLANELFKQPEALIRLDMSEYMEKHSVSKIIGAPPGYVGFDEAGQLTEKIRRRPYAVILFDEIEKAHPDVLNILLQVLDDGKITDAQGRQINFENTIIIMTTNAGSETSSNISGFAMAKDTQAKEKTEKALFSFLRPEFINRVDEIITFRHLTKEDFVKIAALQLDTLRHYLKEEKGMELRYNDDVLNLIAEKSYSEKFGARNMRRFIEREVEDKMAEAMISAIKNRPSAMALTVIDGEINLQTL